MWLLVLVLAGPQMQVVTQPFETAQLCEQARERVSDAAHQALAASRSDYAVSAACVQQRTEQLPVIRADRGEHG
jgi:hypothetical protein